MSKRKLGKSKIKSLFLNSYDIVYTNIVNICSEISVAYIVSESSSRGTLSAKLELELEFDIVPKLKTCKL